MLQAVRSRLSGSCLAWLVFAGCGRLGFDAIDKFADAGVGDAELVADGSGAGFGAPTLIPSLSSIKDEFGATVSGDGLQIAFSSQRSGSWTLYTASRASASAPFGAPLPMTNLEGNGGVTDEELSSDGLDLQYAMSNDDTVVRHARRAAGAMAWTPTGLDMQGHELNGPSLALDDLRMLVGNASGVEEWGRADHASAWTLLRSHPTLDGTSWPGISSDGLEIFVIASVNHQLFRATRRSTDEAFGTREPVRFGAAFDLARFTDPELAADGHSLYLTIDVGDGNGYDIYVATR